MPVTPRFKVSQTDEAVVVCIKVPHVRVGNAETHVDGQEFSFYCKPYLLRLTLPHDLADDDERCKATYDPANEHGTVTVTLPKAVPGEHFPDLDLTTTLLQPRWTPKDLIKEREEDGRAAAGSGIEVVGTEHYENIAEDEDGDETGERTKLSEGVPGGPPESALAGGNLAAAAAGLDGVDVLLHSPRYGFNDKFSGFFVALRDELREMIQLPEPDRTPASARRGLRMEHEEAEFDVDRYLGDLFPDEEDPILTEALGFEPHWRKRPSPPPGDRRGQSRVGGSTGAALQPTSTPSASKNDVKGSQASANGSGAELSDSQSMPSCSRGQGPGATRGSDGAGISNAANVVAEAVAVATPPGSDKRKDGVDLKADGVTPWRDTAGAVSMDMKRQDGEAGPDEESPCSGPEPPRVRLAAAVPERADARAGDKEKARADGETFEGFTEKEQGQMRRLSNREYLIGTGSKEERRVLLGLADLLFAYAYDHRTTAGEPTVESAWTLAILSPLLSWLETPEADAREDSVALSGIRRSLVFPYLRVWELGTVVARDVGDILAAGKRCVLRCLLQMYAILERGEVHYLLNKLFVEDYCVWVQKVSGTSLATFAQAYKRSTRSLKKSSVGLNLEGIEAEAVGEIGGEGGRVGSSACSEDPESSSGQSSSEESSSSEDDEAEEGEESDSEDDSGDEERGRDERSQERPDLEDVENTKAKVVLGEGCSSGSGPQVEASGLVRMASHQIANAAGVQGFEKTANRAPEGAGCGRPGSRKSSELLRLEPRLASGSVSSEKDDDFPIGRRLALLGLSRQQVPGGSTAGRGEGGGAGSGRSSDGANYGPGDRDVAVCGGEAKRLIEEM